MEISVEELNELLDKARKDALNNQKWKYIPGCGQLDDNGKNFYTSYIPEACRHCSNHPSNGGSGICQCILGLPVIY